ncbi:uncharacterized protein N7500_007250 [Penicillium coprophilum]|uniref:uncharacterized protein n=1 Tax=Penicillium coprophilum TaxID=36646 RepID=UPI00239BE4CA|nr:uncharacterized protein N7500_007250 [Penicillium coprophilum]KAJ5165420.1 hypothetical protein N7500_007250 [Penicillium coprophilum]
MGLAAQKPVMVAQNVLDLADIPIVSGIVMFIQTMAGSETKDRNIEKTHVPGIDTSKIMRGGVTTLTKGLHGPDKITIFNAFDKAMVDMWLLPLALCCISIIGALLVERRKIRGHEKEIKDELALASPSVEA